MTKINLAPVAMAALLLTAPVACAQESPEEEGSLQGAVANAIPAWWRIEHFEVLEEDAGAPPTEPSAAAVPAGKTPEDEAEVVDDEAPKPGMTQPADPSLRFAATLELTRSIYEPLYSLDGTAIVRPLMEEGDRIDVTGYALNGDQAAFTDPDAIHFDQEGIAAIGRPLDGFGMPALVQGTDEAEEFIASRDAARAEGMLNKVVGDSGGEL